MIQSMSVRPRIARAAPAWLVAILGALAWQHASAVTDAERATVYHDFRAQFDARKYQEALPLAQQLVSLTEQQYGASDRALVNPLCNLATVSYRLKDYDGAQKSYARSVEILGATASNTDRQLLPPLHGLGATFIAQSDFERAVVPLSQAVDISRNVDGLFNVGQLEFLWPLITSYVALGQRTEADKEFQYAVRVSEDEYGKDNAALLDPLDRYAKWLETTGRYTTSRALHARALSIAEKSSGATSIATVPPLVGIARTYQGEFLNGSEEPAENSNDGNGPTFGMGNMRSDSSNGPHLNPDGERALKQALVTISRAKPLDHRLLGETLVALGDWYLAGSALPKSIEVYRGAWKELEQANATTLLQSPQQIAYKPPSSSAKRSSLDPEEATHNFVELSFTVSREGQVKDIVVVNSDAPDALQRAVQSSVKKARYRPRFERAEPVDTPDVKLREELLLRAKKEAEPKS